MKARNGDGRTSGSLGAVSRGMGINDGLPGGDLPEPERLSACRLWASGIATWFVAALAVVAGVYIAHDILGIPGTGTEKPQDPSADRRPLSTRWSPPRAACRTC